MLKADKQGAFSLFALAVLCLAAFFAADSICSLVEVNFLKREKKNPQQQAIRQSQQISWVPAIYASAEAIKQKRAIMCFFTSKNSGACRILEKELFNDPKIAEFINNNFVAVFVIDDPTLPDTAPEKQVINTYKIKNTPALIITAPDGRLLATKIGSSPTAEYLNFLENHVAITGPANDRPID